MHCVAAFYHLFSIFFFLHFCSCIILNINKSIYTREFVSFCSEDFCLNTRVWARKCIQMNSATNSVMKSTRNSYICWKYNAQSFAVHRVFASQHPFRFQSKCCSVLFTLHDRMKTTFANGQGYFSINEQIKWFGNLWANDDWEKSAFNPRVKFNFVCVCV